MKAALLLLCRVCSPSKALATSFQHCICPLTPRSLGYNPSIGALLLALDSFTQVFGQIVTGHLSDIRAFLEMLALVLPLVSCTLSLIIFSLLSGFSGRGFAVLWAKICLELSDDSTVELETFGIFVTLKGVGNVINGRTTAELIVLYEYIDKYGLGRYKWIVSYCRICMFACSLTMVVLFLSRKLWKQERCER